MSNYVIIVLKKYNFILTKWYVKIPTVNPKAANLGDFILTMWYVNVTIYMGSAMDFMSFILTMWIQN
ncbi:hypothetical protein JY758_17945 [Clostridioides difficile]|uniref:hypothetical protein n=1 Tax=Clostridioides difficile TaxID=1496 RepID=UPI001C178965|nr:hypothetical protein [Clostridioides difficile]MBY2516620.1 hypothetical protein [Clostridioides difficile]MCJ0225448.1 hypothetical protein [Clostridioides difficile]MCJ0427632.1 hypothetical protein [Clostridioides difficile]MCJ0437679.1 hypothetical protein [Clostridioides difficile]MCU5894760.1 hypothetical protein [Clostridioides difficile]